MKSTGIVRKVDELGRIVLPIELRRTLNIDIKDPLEIFVENDQIILRKYNPGCNCCSNAGLLIAVGGISLCPSCLAKFNINNAALKECNHD